MLAGWFCTLLPASFRQFEKGLKLLTATLTELKGHVSVETGLPGIVERYLINTAYLLFECLRRIQIGNSQSLRALSLPSVEEITLLILKNDPACSFAERVFLNRSETA